MKIRMIKSLEIELGNEKILCSHLGKGLFSDCWLHKPTNMVYSITHEDDHSKEIYCQAIKQLTNPHLPFISYLSQPDRSDKRIYAIKYYFPLRAKNKEAWKIFKHLNEIRDEARQKYPMYGNTRNWLQSGYNEMSEIVDKVEYPLIKEALAELVNVSCNWGTTYRLEFNRGNLSVDYNGDLILRDVIYDSELVYRIRHPRR